MSPEDKEIEQQAITYAKKNKTKLARQLTDKTIYAKECRKKNNRIAKMVLLLKR